MPKRIRTSLPSDDDADAGRVSVGRVHIVAAHQTETGGSQMISADRDGRLWLQTNEPVTLEKLQVTHPHLIEMAEEAFLIWEFDQSHKAGPRKAPRIGFVGRRRE